MNTLKIEAKLAEKYGYSPLPSELSTKYREFYKENIPEFLNDNQQTLYTSWGTPLCNGFNRIVIGDYGAFVEFSESDLAFPSYKLRIPEHQEYRLRDKYKNNVKYFWYTTPDLSDIKIYHQKKTVSYADYKPGMYYVSVHEVYDSNSEAAQRYIKRIETQNEIKKRLKDLEPITVYVLRYENSKGAGPTLAVFTSKEDAEKNYVSHSSRIDEIQLNKPYEWWYD